MPKLPQQVDWWHEAHQSQRLLLLPWGITNQNTCTQRCVLHVLLLHQLDQYESYLMVKWSMDIDLSEPCIIVSYGIKLAWPSYSSSRVSRSSDVRAPNWYLESHVFNSRWALRFFLCLMLCLIFINNNVHAQKLPLFAILTVTDIFVIEFFIWLLRN